MGAAAAAIVIKEKRIVNAFRGAGATAPGAAVPPVSVGVAEGAAFRRLRRHAVLREGAPGAFYLDEPSWEACRAMRRRVALAIVIALLLALLAGGMGWVRAW